MNRPAGRRFSGVIPPLATPLTEAGALDLVSLRRLIDHVLARGAAGVFLLGSTGEGTSFTAAERAELITAAVDHVAGRCPVLVGVLEPGSRACAEQARAAVDAGATALVASAPFYVGIHPAELGSHYRTIGRAASATPLLAYDIPPRVHSTLPTDVVIDLAADGVLAGVKDSSQSVPAIRRLIMERDARGLTELCILTGSENTADLSIQLGADGIIPGLGNLDPAIFQRVIDLVRSGDREKATVEQERVIALMRLHSAGDRSRISASSAGVGAIKTALQLMGVIESAQVAEPLCPLDQAETATIEAVLVGGGLLRAAP